MDWQPIETAPDDGTIFMAFVPGGESFYDGFWSSAPKSEPGVVMCRWDDYVCAQDHIYEPLGWTVAHSVVRAGSAPVRAIKPTHWMPLPSPPASLTP